MKQIIFIVITALCCGCTAPSPPSFPNGAGEPQRIVSLKPNITEILFALGAGKRIVGVTTWCDYPPEAQALPHVADYLKPFPEKIVAVHPDLIIGSHENSDKETTLSLSALRIPIQFFPFHTIAETASSIRGIAALIGKPVEGEKLAARIDRLNHLPPANKNRPTALAIVGYRPLIVVGQGTFLSEILNAAGMVNIMRTGSLPYPQLSMEKLLTLNPDIILDMSMGTEHMTRFWEQFPQLKANQHHAIFRLNMDDFRAGPRLPDGVAKLRALYLNSL